MTRVLDIVQQKSDGRQSAICYLEYSVSMANFIGRGIDVSLHTAKIHIVGRIVFLQDLALPPAI